MRWLCLLCSLLAINLAAQPTLETKVDTNIIRIGEQVEIRLMVTYTGEEPEVSWPRLGEELPKELEVVKQADIPAALKGAKTTRGLSIKLTAWNAGSFLVRPMPIEVDGLAFTSDSVLVEVRDVGIPIEEDPREIKPILQDKLTWLEQLKRWAPWLIALLVLAALGYRFYQKNKTGAEVDRAPIVHHNLSPHEKALKELAKLRDAQAWSTMDVKVYYTALNDIVRVYLHDRFGIQALELTTAETMNSLRLVTIDEITKSNAIRLMMQADNVKFAKDKPSLEAKKKSLDDAQLFIENSIPKPIDHTTNG